MKASRVNMNLLVPFKNNMAALYKSLIYGKYKDAHLTEATIEEMKLEIRDYMTVNHPEIVVESVEEEFVKNPFNIMLNLTVLDVSISNKPFIVQFPVLYLEVAES